MVLVTGSCTSSSRILHGWHLTSFAWVTGSFWLAGAVCDGWVLVCGDRSVNWLKRDLGKGDRSQRKTGCGKPVEMDGMLHSMRERSG